MRVGLVSPYSYTYPGGVVGHVEALAEELLREGHDVRMLAPYDPDDRLARVTHRGAAPERRPLPDYLVPLGRTVGFPMNGAVSNLSLGTRTVATLGRELRSGRYDIVHIHEPNAGAASWYATEAARVPSVATFHTYSTNVALGLFGAHVAGLRRLYSKLSGRIAVSEAARWTAERCYGGRYRIVPNGVDLTAARPRQSRGGRRAAAAVRRARGGAQGAARAAARLRGAAQRGRASPADRGGRHARGGPRAAARPRRRRGAGPRERGGEVAPARRGRPAVRALAGRRELRHGAHGGVRLRHAGGGLRHRRLPRRRAPRRGRPARARGRRGRAWRGPSGACREPAEPAWRAPRASAPSASPGPRWPARSWRSTSTRWPSRPGRRWPRRGPGRAASRRGGPARVPRGGCPRSSRRTRRRCASAPRASPGGCWCRRGPSPARASRRSPCIASAFTRSAARCSPPPRSGCWWPSR